MNLIDLAVILIIVLIAVISAKKGFLMSLFNIAAFAVAGVLSKIFSSPVTSYVYDNYLSDLVIKKLNELLPSGSVNGEIYGVVENVMNSLPEFFTSVAKQFGFYPELSNITTDGTLTVDMLEQIYLAPIVVNVLSVVVILILFIFFMVLLKLVLSFVNKILTRKKHKLIRGTNMFLGAALGVVKGIIPAGIFCLIFNIVAPAVNNPQLMELATNSYFCSLIAKLFN